MKKLIKTIKGQSCEVYAISHHRRLMIGEATPNIEIYENSVEVPTIGTNSIRCKNTCLSIVVCPDTKMNTSITDDVLNEVTAFELNMLLPRKDNVYIPFSLHGVSNAELSPDCWVFNITDSETVKRMLTL